MTTTRDAQAPLRDFRKTQDFFVGIDSDGCAFDTMEVKHKECDRGKHSLMIMLRKPLSQLDLRHASGPASV